MNLNYDTCPYCGQKVLSGAMRCVGCGKILKTAEEQAESIEKLKVSQKKFKIRGYIKFAIFLTALGIIYHYFSEEILDLIIPLLEKIGIIGNGDSAFS
jgi:uncharacterized membrane protein YvbJ